jgi:hypothetical protein
MKTSKPKAEPAVEYAREVGYAVGLLESILQVVQNPDRIDAERCNWGHVGDIRSLNEQLRHLESLLCRTGEFHPSNVGTLPRIV